MVTCERDVSVHEFTTAMLKESEGSFARRVRRFEDRFGPADEATLALLGEAAYFCWFGAEYERDLITVCKAIGKRKPASFRSCLQLTPERWIEVNTYVVGVQRWLGVDRPIPQEVDDEKIEQISEWLGERNPAKEMLAVLFLSQLVDHIRLRVSFAKIVGGGEVPRKEEFVDFSDWYVRPDGLTFTTGYDYEESLMGQEGDEFMAEKKVSLFRSRELVARDAGELVMNILKPTPPPCMHRFTRYQDIKLASIGAVKWRGNVPPDDGAKERWRTFRREAESALNGWLVGNAPAGELATKLSDALENPTEQSKAIVRDFLLAPPPDTDFYSWLKEKAERDGTTPVFIFETGRHSQPKSP